MGSCPSGVLSYTPFGKATSHLSYLSVLPRDNLGKSDTSSTCNNKLFSADIDGSSESDYSLYLSICIINMKKKSTKSIFFAELLFISKNNSCTASVLTTAGSRASRHRRGSGYAEYNPIKIVFDFKMLHVSNSQGNVETCLYNNVSTF